jgi:hypothetical protein
MPCRIYTPIEGLFFDEEAGLKIEASISIKQKYIYIL